MPQLPDIAPSFGTLNNPLTPESSRGIATISNPGEDAAAIGQVAKEQGQFANDLRDKQIQVGVASATSNLLNRTIEAQKAAELEPDPQKAADLYNTAKAQALQESAAMVTAPSARQMFMAQSGEHTRYMDMAFGQNQVMKQRQAGLAQVDQATQTVIDNYSRLDSPAQRAQLLQQHQDYLATMKNAGVITPEQFQQQTKEVAYKASLAYYEMHPDELSGDLQKKLGGVKPPDTSLPAVKSAILGQESGNDPDAPDSVDGAIGKEQITPGTFAQYAKPGESIVNNRDRAAVFDRIMTDYNQKYNGDPGRIAVAYFSGPGNVAPPGSATPWLRDVKDGNGKNVSSYVSDIQGRLGGASNDNASPDAGVKIGKPIDNIPAYQALTMAKEAEARGNILGKIQEAQTRQQQESKMNDYLTRGLKGEPTSDIVDDKLLTFEQREKVLTALGNVAKNGEKTDPQVFNDLFRRIHAPDNAPNRLTSPDELIAKVGDGLSFGDYEKLKKEMDGNGTPEGKAEGVMKTTLLKSAESKLVAYPQDQDGKDKFAAFQAWFLPAYDKARAAGKSPDQLLNPDSPDYLGKAAAAFDRPQAERLADRLKDPMQYQAPRTGVDVINDMKAGKLSPDAGKAELLSLAAPIKAEIKSGALTKEQGRAKMISLGLISQ